MTFQVATNTKKHGQVWMMSKHSSDTDHIQRLRFQTVLHIIATPKVKIPQQIFPVTLPCPNPLQNTCKKLK